MASWFDDMMLGLEGWASPEARESRIRGTAERNPEGLLGQFIRRLFSQMGDELSSAKTAVGRELGLVPPAPEPPPETYRLPEVYEHPPVRPRPEDIGEEIRYDMPPVTPGKEYWEGVAGHPISEEFSRPDQGIFVGELPADKIRRIREQAAQKFPGATGGTFAIAGPEAQARFEENQRWLKEDYPRDQAAYLRRLAQESRTKAKQEGLNQLADAISGTYGDEMARKLGLKRLETEESIAQAQLEAEKLQRDQSRADVDRQGFIDRLQEILLSPYSNQLFGLNIPEDDAPPDVKAEYEKQNAYQQTLLRRALSAAVRNDMPTAMLLYNQAMEGIKPPEGEGRMTGGGMEDLDIVGISRG